jgi:DNA-binding response OmpR family regulator
MATRRILLVDDDRLFRESLSTFLTAEGYAVAAAQDGIAALELVKTFQPDVILLDMFLADMTGQAFWNSYRTSGQQRVPVIAVSGAPSLGRLVQVWGVDDYVAKPFDIGVLLACIEKHLASEEP